MYEFKMPSLGTEMTHGTLLEWLVKVGDKIKPHEIIAVIDTDKTAIEIESFGEGIIEKFLVRPGEKVPVGTVMALVSGGQETIEKKAIPQTSKKIKITPRARKIASALNIDISKINGTGFDDGITEKDIRKASTPLALGKEDHAQSMKEVIAAATEKSKREIPHYYLSCEINLSNALNWLENYNNTHSVTERILYIALLIKAVVHALKKFPEFNGFYINDEYKPSPKIHMGIAVSLRDGGLIAPAILNTEQQSLAEIMSNMIDLVSRARAGKLKGAEISDSSITITNLGELGVNSVFGIIYPPQVALVGFGKITTNKTITATLSADHRVTNGLTGSHFLSTIDKILQEPEKL